MAKTVIQDNIPALLEFYEKKIHDAQLKMNQADKEARRWVGRYNRLKTGNKECSSCKEVRSLKYFWRAPKRPDGYRSRCAFCTRKTDKHSKIKSVNRFTKKSEH